MDFLVQHAIQRLYDHTPYGTQRILHQIFFPLVHQFEIEKTIFWLVRSLGVINKPYDHFAFHLKHSESIEWFGRWKVAEMG